MREDHLRNHKIKIFKKSIGDDCFLIVIGNVSISTVNFFHPNAVNSRFLNSSAAGIA